MPKRKMKILVTGGAGFIGSSLAERLQKRFFFVNYDIRNSRKENVLDKKRLAKKVKEVDGVLHLAAVSRPKWGFENPHHCLTTNIVGTMNVLEVVRKANPSAWVILGSSREVFGNVSSFPATEKSQRSPLNAYGVSKKTGEDILKQYAENYALRCLAIRFCGVYTGPNDILDRVIPKFIGQAIRNEPLTIEGDGKLLGDYVYIDDVVRGLEKAIKYISGKPNGFYGDINLVAQNPVSLSDLAALIVRLSKSDSQITYHPARTYDQKGFWGSFAKAKKELGWTPEIKLENGLKKAIRDLKPIFGLNR